MVKTTVQPISTQEDLVLLDFEKFPILYISCYRFSVAMEAAMSTKHTSKIKFNVRYVVSFCGFSVHALQPKLWDIKQEGVRS